MHHLKSMKHGHTIPTFTDEQVSSFLHQVKEIAPNTLLLSSLTDSEDTDSAPETTTQDPARSAGRQQLSVELPLCEIYKNTDLETAKKVQLIFECCCEIEAATRDQAKSPRWLKERKGRITASLLHRVAACSTGAASLVAEIMGYIKTPQVANLRWGSEMEKKS
ncbi:hypothetical protein MTO96_052053 [Rhipicephalus appendiculatus]